MKITFLGHACFLIEVENHRMIIDPFISANPAAEKIDVNAIQVNTILVTHAHQDHILDVETIAKNNPDVLLVSNHEIATHYATKGIKTQGMNHGGKFVTNFGFVKYTNAIHSSSFPDGSYGGQPGGFVISSSTKKIYIAGDTSLTYDMKLIPLTCGKMNLAILPIGDTYTMGVEEAVIAADFVDVTEVVGCHYDTFPPITIDKQKAVDSFRNNGKKLFLMDIGETKEV